MTSPVLPLIVVLGAYSIGRLARGGVPGPDPMPVWLTFLIGLPGVIFPPASVLLVVLYRRLVQGRGLTGPEAKVAPTRGPGAGRYRARLARELAAAEAEAVPAQPSARSRWVLTGALAVHAATLPIWALIGLVVAGTSGGKRSRALGGIVGRVPKIKGFIVLK